MASPSRTGVTLATVGMLLPASSTVWADGDARTWAAVKKWTGTATVRVTYKTARTVDGTSITMSVSRLLSAKVTFEIDKDKTPVDESGIVSWHSTTCEVTGNVQDEAKAVGSDGGVMRETWRASGPGDDCELHLAIEAGPGRKERYSFAPSSLR